jgi:hypothetical protein
MDLFFLDDAQQNNPSRPGMGRLVAVGGIYVPEQSVQELEMGIEALCVEYGFPAGEIFKWSPGRELWMYQNLIDKRRQEFFISALRLAKDKGAIATVIIEDTKYAKATNASSHEADLVTLFLERAHLQLTARECNGIVIVSQPGGDRKRENKFLADCIDTLRCGTDYVKPDKIVLNVLCSPPKFIRLLQVADVITSCTTAFVSGENSFSPPVFETIKTLFARELGRIGGVGLKIHPDLKYANLYYWLLGDSHFVRSMQGFPFPLSGYQYGSDPYAP